MSSPLVMSDEDVTGGTCDSASDLVTAETVYKGLAVEITD